jgi:hypothetical protein
MQLVRPATGLTGMSRLRASPTSRGSKPRSPAADGGGSG